MVVRKPRRIFRVLLALLTAVTLLPGAAALAEEFDILSTSFTRGTFGATLPSISPAISADGRTVAYETFTNPAPRGHSIFLDIVVYSADTDDTVSLTGGADSHSAHADISSDGRYVTFLSQASNLNPEDINGNLTNVFVHDRETGEFEIIAPEQTLADLQINRWLRPESLLRISGNGRFVAFYSRAGNLRAPSNPEGPNRLYLWDRETQVLKWLTEGADQDSAGVDISDDGSHVVFSSAATNLLPLASSATSRVYSYNTLTETLSVLPGTEGGREPAISGDGRFVAFTSAELSSPVPELFLLDRVSAARRAVTPGINQGAFQPSLSADGNKLAFVSSASNLVPDDTSGALDIFIYTRDTDTLSRPTAGADRGSLTPAIDATGDAIAFATSATNLLNETDTNRVVDIYTWRSAPLEAADCELVPTSGVLRSTSGVSVRVAGRDTCLRDDLVSFGSTDSNGFVVPPDQGRGQELQLVPQNVGDLPFGELVFYKYPQVDGSAVYAANFAAGSQLAVTMSFRSSSLTEFEVFEFAVYRIDPLDREQLVYVEHGTTWTFSSEELPPTVTVAGQIFEDLNADGQLDAGEGPVPDIVSTDLFFCSDQDGLAGGDTIREEDAGALRITDLAPANYQLRVGLPSGWTFSRGGFDENGDPVSPIRSVQTLSDGRPVAGFTGCMAFDGVDDPVLEIGMSRVP